MKYRKHYLMVASIAFAIYGAGVVFAMTNDAIRDQADFSELQASKISLEQAADKIQNAFPNMLIASANVATREKKPVYNFEMLKDGSEKKVMIDMKTGLIYQDD